MKLITKQQLLKSDFRSDYDRGFAGTMCLLGIAFLVFICIAILAVLEAANNITIGGAAAAGWGWIICGVGICFCAYGALANFVRR